MQRLAQITHMFNTTWARWNTVLSSLEEQTAPKMVSVRIHCRWHFLRTLQNEILYRVAIEQEWYVSFSIKKMGINNTQARLCRFQLFHRSHSDGNQVSVVLDFWELTFFYNQTNPCLSDRFVLDQGHSCSRYNISSGSSNSTDIHVKNNPAICRTGINSQKKGKSVSRCSSRCWRPTAMQCPSALLAVCLLFLCTNLLSC